jgi:hypothetical protein
MAMMESTLTVDQDCVATLQRLQELTISLPESTCQCTADDYASATFDQTFYSFHHALRAEVRLIQRVVQNDKL